MIRPLAASQSSGAQALIYRYNLKNFSYGHLSVLRAETMQFL